MNVKELILSNLNSTPRLIELSNQYTLPDQMSSRLWNFVIKEEDIYNPTLDLQTIQGAEYCHQSETAITWGDMLHLLRRFDSLSSIDCDPNSNRPNISYYLNNKYQNDDPWGIRYVNGFDYGFVLEGHHRTTIAKYLSALGKIPYKISCFKYAQYITIDWKAYKAINRIEQFLKRYPEWFRSYIEFNVTSERKKDMTIKDENHYISTNELIFSIKVGEVYPFFGGEYIPCKECFTSIKDFRKKYFEYFRYVIKTNKLRYFLYKINPFKKFLYK